MKFRVVARPCLDIFQSQRLIPNMVSLKLNFHRAPSEFCIMNFKAGRKYKIKITKAAFHMKRVVVVQETYAAIEKNLGSGLNLLYPTKGLVIKPTAIPTGTTCRTIDTLFSNQYIPERLLLTFVEQSAFTGEYAKNPFNLQHFHIQECQVELFGRTYRETFDWDSSDRSMSIVPYENYIKLLGQGYPDGGTFAISKNDYTLGNFVICFDLSPDEAFRSGNSFAGIKGNIVLNLRFKNALTKPIILLATGVYDNTFMMGIDRSFTRPFAY